jgi:hypothetical protein
MAAQGKDRDLTSAPPPWHNWAAALLERAVVVDRAADGAEDDAAALVAAAEAELAAADAALAATDALDDAYAGIVTTAELDPVSARILALCAAVEVDRRLQRLVAALQRDVAATRVVAASLAQWFGTEALHALADDAPLARAALVEMDRTTALAATPVVVPRTVVWALLDAAQPDPALDPAAYSVTAPEGSIGTADFVVVHGSDRVRCVQAAATATWGIEFIVTPPPVDEAGWRVLVRQASVAGLGVVLELIDPPDALARRWIDRASHLAFALCSAAPLAIDALPERDYLEIAAPSPRVTDTEWDAVFGAESRPGRRPTAAQLRAARRVPGVDPAAAMRRVASGTLLKHANRIVPSVGWADLILPPAQERRLHDLVDRYRYRSVVHEEWGLPQFPSPGVVTLFSGPSGTGKTTTAEVIARELGVDMFRVDLSALVSKYIGETEKNLEEIFSAAHAGDYLLLFDEADALFGTRSKVSDARDRYANMEVSYLLQRLESYDGFVVLTSNFQGNIDPAFLRRIHVTVHFVMPSVEDRARIWQRCLAKAPTDRLDLPFVAEKFDLTGGSIRNAALTAAFFAASGHRPVGMVDVLRAISQEMAKLGRRPNDDQFGRWLDELQD